MTDLADLDIEGAGRAIAAGELSAVELTEACLGRATLLEGDVKAFTLLDGAGALRQARALDDERARGDARGPLHGIPLCIKDLVDVEGLPTTASSRVLRDNIARTDAPVVARLRAAGGVIVGKTNTQEFAYGVVTAPTVNPWDRDRIPGGSSGGSAAAIAAGMSLGGVGTDTAGSIRIPSALCGISGLKPRPGIVSLEGIIPLAPSLDACGPMARTASDLGVLLDAMAEVARERVDATRLRVALPDDVEVAAADPEVAAAVADATRVLSDNGLTTVEVSLPSFEEWDVPRSLPLMLEALEVHRSRNWYPDKQELYTEETLGSLRYAETVDAAKISDAARRLSELKSALVAVFERADVLVLPATQGAAPTVAEAMNKDGGHRTPVVRRLTRLCGPMNVCGLAAASVPCGFSSDGLPIGLQLVGREESAVLAVAEHYQSLTEWHERRPSADRFGSTRS
jgi:aspartyl-tRNA(Asn)/glutamyl-tRNA(Gln) amidotransferase subunit A